MTRKNIETGLTRGLLAGYGGKTDLTKIKRAGFSFVSSHLVEDNLVYHDEWLASDVGGGQELLKINGQKFTRFYAGGTIKKTDLAALGISNKDVIDFLIMAINKLGNHTRLFKDSNFLLNETWLYSYEIVDHVEPISLTTAKEQIFYKNKLVFVHNFLLCPIIIE